jgi:hypothetical protein
MKNIRDGILDRARETISYPIKACIGAPPKNSVRMQYIYSPGHLRLDIRDIIYLDMRRQRFNERR